MKITITKYDDFRYNFTCDHCYIDLRNHTFNIPGALGIDSIGFERLKHIEIKNVEEIEMNEDRLYNIRMQLIRNIFKNPDVVFNVDPEILDLIVALYEELHLMVMHEHYDYMWHWINKCTGSIQDTTVFDPTGKHVILLQEEMKNEKEKGNR